MSKRAKAVLQTDKLDVVADRGYFDSEEILACDEANIEVTLPKPMTSGNRSDFRYVKEEDVYICPAGERLIYHYTNVEHGLTLRRYWTNVCGSCAIKDQCTTGKERRNRFAADSAYGTGKFLAWLIDKDITPHVTVRDLSKRKDGTFSRSDFSYLAGSPRGNC